MTSLYLLVAGEILRLKEELCSRQTETRLSLSRQDRLVGQARALTARAAEYRAQVSTDWRLEGLKIENKKCGNYHRTTVPQYHSTTVLVYTVQCGN